MDQYLLDAPLEEHAATELARVDGTRVNMRSIWGGEDQTYKTYDARVCTYSIAMLDSVLGESFATAPHFEKAAFVAYCIATKLDPIRGQLYFIKYSRNKPASFVVSWEVFLARAQQNPAFDGFKQGIVWRIRTRGHCISRIQQSGPCDHQEDERHQIAGGWCIVYRKDRQVPQEVVVPIEEMMACRQDGEPVRSWASMKTTMAMKVPTSRALRQSFPEDLAALYTEGETQRFVQIHKPEEASKVDLDNLPTADDGAVISDEVEAQLQ